ncbi:hypothetical protein BJ684DRAFT_15382 [Piptocephalis cylindrospora]|uniref:Pentacotripeptide-repeat region of PRORP domain-containing protein n=1 Tax=Piptocephalis cylindrospora TaxID=1907219 RepID=A0A4P9Y6E3_9FUNG|nr:hypothetical protein BJ684DRAFT_15382 [Piptocephalis cylindrospora]|eukprot:RKP14284.1 hypothetical protein BJ684DRAFT_15382 [Piptocephalis cylindrospora]
MRPPFSLQSLQRVKGGRRQIPLIQPGHPNCVWMTPRALTTYVPFRLDVDPVEVRNASRRPRRDSVDSTTPPSYTSPFTTITPSSSPIRSPTVPFASNVPAHLWPAYKALSDRSEEGVSLIMPSLTSSPDQGTVEVIRGAMALYRPRGYAGPQQTLDRENNISVLHQSLDYHGESDLQDWTTLLKAKARMGRTQEVKELWKTMEQGRVVPGLWAWQAYAHAHAQSRNFLDLEKVLNQARQAGYPLGGYGTLLRIQAYGKARKGKMAIQLLQDLDAHDDLTPQLMDALVLTLGDSDMVNEMLKLLKDPVKLFPSLRGRPWPRPRSFRLAFHSLALAPAELSAEVYQIMQARDVPLDASCYEHLILRLSRDRLHIHRAAELFVQMRRELRHPASAHLYDRLIKRCRHPRWDSFREILLREQHAFQGRMVKSHRLF